MLATLASLSDEGLRDAREHYATLLEARPKPHVLDDATNRALWTGDVALGAAGTGPSELPDQPTASRAFLTGVRNPARQPKPIIKADADRLIATPSGGESPAAWSSNFEVHQIRDEAELVRAAWEFEALSLWM